jgi:hypothetical protein
MMCNATRYFLILALLSCLAWKSAAAASRSLGANTACFVDSPAKSKALAACFSLKAGRIGDELTWAMPCRLDGKSTRAYKRLLNSTSLPSGVTPLGFAIPATTTGLNIAVNCAEKSRVDYIIDIGGPQVGGGDVLPYSCSLGSASSSNILVINLNRLAGRNFNDELDI